MEQQQERHSDLGFGNQLSEGRNLRLINKDGAVNNLKINAKSSMAISDRFHDLIVMRWRKFIFILFVGFGVLNIFFASIYYSLGPASLGIVSKGFASDFGDCFFFSTQCYTTVGFGKLSPQTFSANVVSSIESLVGLMTLAIMTGLLYAKFSRLDAHLVRSKHLLISPYKEGTAVMVKLSTHRKKAFLIENVVEMSVSMDRLEEGVVKRRNINLKLELDTINILASTWTLVHYIDSNSPLFGLKKNDFKARMPEFLVFFKAVDSTTGQTVYDRFSYFGNEIVWNAKFKSSFYFNDKGKMIVDLNTIDDHDMLKPTSLKKKSKK